MYVEAIGQQIAVCSFDEAARLTVLDKNFWNVISIHGPQDRKAHLRLAKTVHYSCFDDVEEEDSTFFRSPRAVDVVGIFDHIRSLVVGTSCPPLMIHCQQGISRSTAVALAWIYRQLPSTDDRSAKSIDLILKVRPQARPNRLVLAFGLAQFMEPAEARRLAYKMASAPRFKRNQFGTPTP
jgi:predicted protein tyrosine phosphatase